MDTPRRSKPVAFQQSLRRSVEDAWAEAASADEVNRSKLFQAQIVGDLWPPMFKHGSLLLLERRPIESVKQGQFVLVREKGQLRVTRFIDWSFNEQGIQVLIKVGPRDYARESYPARDVVGAIVAIRKDGKDIDPNKESPLARLGNAMTDYGTSTPFQKALRLAKDAVHSLRDTPDKKKKQKGFFRQQLDLLREHKVEKAREAELAKKRAHLQSEAGDLGLDFGTLE